MGKFVVAHAAIDNAIAMIETDKRDVVIVAGGDAGLDEFIARPGIERLADLHGTTYMHAVGCTSNCRP